MPDHLHILVEAETATADVRAFVKDFKQRSAFAYKRRTGRALWQDSYHDHVLRDDEPVVKLTAYTLANPVRAGLVRHPREWPYLGSGRYEIRELLDTLVSGPEGPHHT